MLTALQLAYRKHSFIRFMLVGFLNTLFGYTVFSFFILFAFHYSLAIFLALLSGILFNFFTYGHYVFYENNPKSFLRFIFAYFFLYGMNMLSVSFLLSLHVNIYLAQAIITLPMVIGAYKLNKDFVFNTRLRQSSS